MPSTKTERLNLRVTRQDDELFRHAAELNGESLSDFLVEGGRERAERLVADQVHFELNQTQWEAFHAALDRPAEVRPAFVELFARRRP